jgi:hypothetical protein
VSINPKKSREARSQIGAANSGTAFSAAVSVQSLHPQDSLARGICDLRGAPSPMFGRDATSGQPSPLKRYVERRRERDAFTQNFGCDQILAGEIE